MIGSLGVWECGSVGVQECGGEGRDVGAPLSIEINLGYLAELSDGILDGGGEDLPEGLFVLELDLGLGGVDIDIDVGGADVEIEEIGDVEAGRDETVVGLLDSLMEIGVAHIAAIDEEILGGSLLAGGLGLGGEAADVGQGGIDADGQQVLEIAASIDVGDALARCGAAQVEEFLAVAVEGEGEARVDECDALEGRQDVVEFGGIALEELTAGRDVVEQVAHGDAGADGTGTGLLALDTRGSELEEYADLVGGTARAQLYLRHGDDGRQGLAAEPHGMEAEEVVGLSDFRRGMALEGQPGVGHGHAAAVVDDLQAGASGIDDDDVDGLCAGIDGILDEFLDDRGRALDDLAGGNLVGHAVRKQLYDVTHRGSRYLVCYRLCLGASRTVCCLSSVPAFLGRQLKMS